MGPSIYHQQELCMTMQQLFHRRMDVAALGQHDSWQPQTQRWNLTQHAQIHSLTCIACCFLQNALQVMHYAISVEKKRIAVHCHAGLGRTGLTIACFLVACGEAANAAQAVEMVRAARPGSLQTQAQVMFVSIFEQYLHHLR
jgi:protein tyrosine phosphatase